MKKKPIKKMTIEKLGQMSQREFLSIGGRFDKVDERFDKVDEDARLLRRDMEAGFGALAEILKSIRADLKDIKSDVATVNEDYQELRIRVERLEKKVGLAK